MSCTRKWPPVMCYRLISNNVTLLLQTGAHEGYLTHSRFMSLSTEKIQWDIAFGNTGFGKIGFGKTGFGEIGFGKIGFGKTGFGEIGFGKIGFGKT